MHSRRKRSEAPLGEVFGGDEFVSRLKKRDAEAISLIVRAYTAQIYRASLGLGFDANAAQELTQSVWVTFFDVVGSFEGGSKIRTFIFGILYNKASELRREQLKSSADDPIEQIVDRRFDERGDWINPPIDPEVFLGSVQTLSIIQKCLDALPVPQRMAFVLREIQEEDTAEISRALEVSATNLGVLLFRAKNRLRECIEGKTKVRI